MPKRYSKQFRKMVAKLICVQNEGIIKTERFSLTSKVMEEEKLLIFFYLIVFLLTYVSIFSNVTA